MATIINEHCFEPPDYDRHYKQARLGMLRPEPDKLRVGHFYYKSVIRAERTAPK